MSRLEKYNQSVQQKEARINKLTQTISENENTLVTLTNQYKQLVSDSEDEKADSLFEQLEKLKNTIKADKHKLQTLIELNKESIRNLAINTLQEFNDIKTTYQNKVGQALKKIDQAKKAYIQSLDLLDGINESYQKEARKYEILIDKHDIKRTEVSNDLYHDITSYRGIAPLKWTLTIEKTDIQKGIKQ